MNRLLIFGLYLQTLIFCINYAVVSAEKPIVIPTLKEWNEGGGNFIFTKDIKLIVDAKDYDSLFETATVFNDDLFELKKFRLQISKGSSAQINSIFLTLTNNLQFKNTGGYTFSVDGSIIINSSSVTGVFYGTRTLLQLLKQSDTLQGGFIKDEPDFPERGFMIDNGRKYFSVDWIKNHIKELAYFKCNIFHFHISDNQGFRLECLKYPQIQSKEYYTKSEISSIIELARKYHVTIIPEIDFPNHAYQILKNIPELALKDTNGSRLLCCMDISLDESYQFIGDLFEEYMELFPGKYWHLGGDEYNIDFGNFPQLSEFAKKNLGENAFPEDALIIFINKINKMVKSYKKTLRVWNDWSNHLSAGKNTVMIDRDIISEYWFGKENPQSLLDMGYKLMNSDADYLYYVVGNNWKPYHQHFYDSFNPLNFYGKQEIEPDNKNFLGSKFQIWCDIPDSETETQIANTFRKHLRMLAQKNWNYKDKSRSFLQFFEDIDKIGLAPGVKFPENPVPNNLTFGKKVVASSVEPNSDLIPENVIDGDYTSRWASNLTDNEWIYIDFGEPTNFTRVNIKWEYAYATAYQIQVSDDTLNWTNIFETSTGNGYDDDHSNLHGRGRYLKINCTKRVATNGYSIYEIEVFDSTKITGNHPEIDTDDYITIYPNPADNFIEIEYFLNKYSNFNYTIYDIFGKEVEYSKIENDINENQKLTLDLKELKSGVYFIHFIIDNKFITKKFIKVD